MFADDQREPAETGERRVSHLRNRYLLLIDAALLPLMALLAFVIRFEGGQWPLGTEQVFTAYVLCSLPVKLLVLRQSGLYSRLWRYASVSDLEVLAGAAAASAVTGALVGLGIVPFLGFALARVPLSVLVLDGLLSAVAIVTPRLLARVGVHRRRRRGDPAGKRALIVGAGAAGAMIVRELLYNPQLGLRPTALIDDDPSKHQRTLHGVPVLGTLNDLEAVAARAQIDEVIIAMPSAPGTVVRNVVQSAQRAAVPTRTVPGVYEILDGRKSVSALRRVEIEDLLRREPVRTDLERVRKLAADKTVLVTGAGGSIGAELCRQLARLGPAKIVAVGRGENSIFELLQELSRLAPEVKVQPIIADVRDAGRMARVFEATRPHTVFHAAAHKHVPLMEANVAEAVLNNVLGTQVVAEVAEAFGTERLVLISSDKAVRPSSVMGATKRLAEGVVQRYAARSGRSFVSVRFGNVLGSRGSVVPTFLRQIEAGGPITITHPEMRRFFMTIPEAVQLVLQAGVMGVAGEVFVLDMGEPVKVLDLARDLIRLSGLEEGRDIEIKFSGTRPGEKLYEELFFGVESAIPTAHPKILRARNAALDVDGAFSVDELIALAAEGAPTEAIRCAIKALVPEFTGGTGEGAEPRVALAATSGSPNGSPNGSTNGSSNGDGRHDRRELTITNGNGGGPDRETPRPDRSRTPTTSLPAAGMVAGPARGSAQRLSV